MLLNLILLCASIAVLVGYIRYFTVTQDKFMYTYEIDLRVARFDKDGRGWVFAIPTSPYAWRLILFVVALFNVVAFLSLLLR